MSKDSMKIPTLSKCKVRLGDDRGTMTQTATTQK